MTLSSLLQETDDPLRPQDDLDVVLYYAAVAAAMQDYLSDRELCGKIFIPDGPVLLKRGSELPPLTATDLATAIDDEFLALRQDPGHLDDVRDQLSDVQERVWQYFYPRKYAEFLYATNHEGEGKPIDRVFYDIDRGEHMTAADALAVTRAFILFLEEDSVVQDVQEQTVIKWTGASFHVEIMLDEQKPGFFYDNHVFTSKNERQDTITGRAVDRLQTAVDVDVVGTHETQSDAITIDPSQTPSGKLDRVPLGSLHMADAETVDGVSVPLTRDELFDDGVLDMVQSYTPETVLQDRDELAAKL